MKLKLKMIAIAAAMASLAGTAQAALTSGGTVENGSLSLVVFNEVTNAWYIRDLGLLINDFLPSTITTAPADGAVTGSRTPSTGLTIAGAAGPGVTVQANFSDAAFSTWFSAQTPANVRWMVGAYDQISDDVSGSQRRLISTSTATGETWTNSNLDNFVSESNYGGLSSLFGSATLSATGTGLSETANTGFNSGLSLSTLGLVGSSQNLFYAVRSAFTGAGTTLATRTPFGNGAGRATLTLEADGDLIYALAPEQVAAVPLPAAAWLMGAGMLALGGAARRRRDKAVA